MRCAKRAARLQPVLFLAVTTMTGSIVPGEHCGASGEVPEARLLSETALSLPAVHGCKAD